MRLSHKESYGSPYAAVNGSSGESFRTPYAFYTIRPTNKHSKHALKKKPVRRAVGVLPLRGLLATVTLLHIKKLKVGLVSGS
jgi:hypothetical protein